VREAKVYICSVDSNGPFPFEAARDLLGLARALYSAARERDAGADELANIALIGTDLREAIALARQSRRGTIGWGAARRRVFDACERLPGLIDRTCTADVLVEAIRARFKEV
jgi:hypothetical protein